MPKTLADARTRLVALTTKPANPAAPTVTELTAGIDLSCRILKSDYRLSPVASDTVPDTELCSEGNAVTFGASNYEGSVTPFRYLTEAGKADAANDIAWDTLKEKGTELWLYEREGPKYDAAWAAADEVDGYEVVTDNPQKPSDRAGFIKRVVPLGVQRAWLGGVVAAP
ncbi:hypothetical protein H9623_13285 [Oerskovia sp. Sa1BUA8]|uniref:Uncharacterized protein n=1 Tax=Oerskovia douganii TaxID=2762210 RepID=A0A9D5UA03_9CELL|nr:hypothetical protein [Oerskovia douganii]MBE7701268.1 hypothetical protein [Oerskovia douganii]